MTVEEHNGHKPSLNEDISRGADATPATDVVAGHAAARATVDHFDAIAATAREEGRLAGLREAAQAQAEKEAAAEKAAQAAREVAEKAAEAEQLRQDRLLNLEVNAAGLRGDIAHEDAVAAEGGKTARTAATRARGKREQLDRTNAAIVATAESSTSPDVRAHYGVDEPEQPASATLTPPADMRVRVVPEPAVPTAPVPKAPAPRRAWWQFGR